VETANYLDLTPGMSNIFGIPDAEEYTCSFHSGMYALGHHLWFRVYHEHKPSIKPINIVFDGVTYFDGPMNWISANFSVAPSDDCLALLNWLGYINDGAPADVLEDFGKGFKLLVAPCGRFSHHTVRIIVTSAYRSDGIPPHFVRATV
jgi:hypothetical protein